MPSHPEASRRGFLKATAATAAAAAFHPQFTVADEGAKGANQRIGVGFIGVGNRCQEHIRIVNKLKAEGRCEPVAVCDVYLPHLEAAAQRRAENPTATTKNCWPTRGLTRCALPRLTADTPPWPSTPFAPARTSIARSR